MATVKFEGQEVQISDEIANDDQALIRTLKPFYDLGADPQFERVNKDGGLVVTITKRAGKLGGDLVEQALVALQAAPRWLNPALQMLGELMAAGEDPSTVEEIIQRRDAIFAAIEEGKEEIMAIEKAQKRLYLTYPHAATAPPLGF